MKNNIHSDKKIRIVSFQNAHNFGAILQAYGLQQTLIKYGYNDVLFLNYNPAYLKDRYAPLLHFKYVNLHGSLVRVIIRIIKCVAIIISTYIRNYFFKQSIKKLLKQTRLELHTLNDVSKEQMDILICGSDQIWNISITNGFDSVFWGISRNKLKLIAYAPSTEISLLSEELIFKIAEKANRFHYISVRERNVKELLQPYIRKSVEVCIDPTILCGVESFNKISSERLVAKPYIIVYAYNHMDELVQNVIKSIPNVDMYEIHYILFSATNMFQWKNRFIHSSISVGDFVSYIKHASYVITNSFHGLAFSLLYEKQFNVTWVEQKSNRCQSLLSDVGLLNRIVRDASNTNWENINYYVVNKRISNLREESLKFLLNSIEF